MVKIAHRLVWRACALMLSAATAAELGAQETAAGKAGSPTGEDILVTGPALDALDKYVAELTDTPNGKQIDRWNSAICAHAVGLAPAKNAFLAGHVDAAARAIRIPVERPGCRPNILVVVTEEPDIFARQLLRRHPKLFGAYGGNMAPAAASAALLAPRPVRWLNASSWGNGHGAPIVDANTNFVYSMSRLQETTRENATLSLVIVDATQIGGVTWGELGSYIAMVALARPAADVAPEGPTILSLFRSRDAKQKRPGSLTRWDREFLKSLYSTKANASGTLQRSQIQSSMDRRLASQNQEFYESGQAQDK